MLGYFIIIFGTSFVLQWGFSTIDSFFEIFATSEPSDIVNIFLSLIPFLFAPGYLISLSTVPNQVPLTLLFSTLAGFALFILLTWVMFRKARRALRITISTEIKTEKVEKKEIKVEVKPTSPIKAYIRKDLISSTRDLQSFMFIFLPIFYPLVLVFTLQGPIISEVTTIEGILILWSIVLGVYLFIPPMLIAGFLNIEESGSSTTASLPIIPRDQAKAKIILMLSIQGISLTIITIILTLLTNSIIVPLLFLATLPIAWTLLLLVFVLKIHLFGKIKYKYIIEELNKEHKISKWVLMILCELGLYITILLTGILLLPSFNIFTTILVLMIIGIVGLSTLIFSFTRMFPKVKKMAYYKTGSFLREHANVATVVLMLLYFVFMFLASPIEMLFILLIENLSFLGFLFIDFIISFGILIPLWLVIVPLGLKLPKKETFREFSQTIGFSSVKPLWRNILLGVGILVIFGVSTSLFAIFLGTWIFDINVLFGEPSIYTGLGWFLFISMLRPGIWEEVAFRGVILNLQLKRYSQTTSIILNGVLFGLFHFVNLLYGQSLYLTSMQVIYASCLGIAFSYMYVKTQSLLPSMVAHYLVNSVGQLFLLTFFSNIINLTIYFIFGIGIIPMILTIVLVKLTVRNGNKFKELRF
jgi:membrane protease YdiL (CAAX protease family)